MNKVLAGIAGGAALGGIVVGMLLRPVVAPDSRVGKLEKQVDETNTAAETQKTRANNLEKELEGANNKKKEVEKKLEVATKAETTLADKVSEAEKKKADAEAAQKKLTATMKGLAGISVEGEELRLSINTGALFLKDDQLSDRGKQIIDRVGASLKELPDRNAWVQGHTDDIPLPVVKPPTPPPAQPKKPGAKPAPPAPVVPAPPQPRFATNWELSAGRAVAVVRHLQEVSKVDPTRLGAVGFGQYRPVSRRDRGLNRRIDVILYPKPAPKK